MTNQRKYAPTPIKVTVTFTGDLATGLEREAMKRDGTYPLILRIALRAWLDRENDAQRIGLSLRDKEADS